jgi:hypothetical protein
LPNAVRGQPVGREWQLHLVGDTKLAVAGISCINPAHLAAHGVALERFPAA